MAAPTIEATHEESDFLILQLGTPLHHGRDGIQTMVVNGCM